MTVRGWYFTLAIFMIVAMLSPVIMHGITEWSRQPKLKPTPTLTSTPNLTFSQNHQDTGFYRTPNGWFAICEGKAMGNCPDTPAYLEDPGKCKYKWNLDETKRGWLFSVNGKPIVLLKPENNKWVVVPQ